jgi:lipopolysaccharide transport system permease protein
LSPVLFPLALFPPDWRWVLWINPITPFVLAYQDILLQGEWPQWQHWAAMGGWLLGGLVLLLPVLRHSRDQVVDWL